MKIRIKKVKEILSVLFLTVIFSTTSFSQTGCPTINIQISTTDVTCPGFTDGSASASVNGGFGPPYTYSWSPYGGSSATASNLSANYYTLTVTDVNGCIETAIALVTEPPPLVSIITNIVNNRCYGASDGSISTHVSGGTPPYQYLWYPYLETTPSLSNLSAGTYMCIISDANGCTTTTYGTVVQPSPVVISVIGNDVSCVGDSNGSATVSVSGGTGPYTYLWTPSGVSSSYIVNLSTGTYSATVTDATGCTASSAVTINQPAPIQLQISTLPASCSSANGSATVVACCGSAGGSPPYTYTWSPSGGNDTVASGLMAGTYSVTVTGSNGCDTTATVVISSIGGPTVSTFVTSQVSCANGSNGSVFTNVFGGTPPYQYSWFPTGGNADTASSLSAGTYTVTVTDSAGCTSTSSVTITEPPAIIVTISSTNVSVLGASDGSATVSVSGGAPPYSYLWAPSGATTPTINWLTAGNYIVTISDASGCTSTSQVSISQSCTQPYITISAPLLRRCSPWTLPVYGTACNDSSAGIPIIGAYAKLSFPPEITVVSSTIPISLDTASGNYIAQLGDIYPGQCIDFTIQVNIDCNATIGQTLCMQAELLPLDSCALDTVAGPGDCILPWDRSSLSVQGNCIGDSLACFTITNSGSPVNGNMQCYSEVRVFYNGLLTYLDSVRLSGASDTVLCFPADGSTIRLEVDQHPLHPGNSRPNAVVELCGDSTHWVSGMVNAQPTDDEDPQVDVFCGEILASFDPNDKAGAPTGLDMNYHYIEPDQDLEYLIRFQNTGNDTAFTVVIRDTINPNFNLLTIRNGSSSHPNTFRILSGGVLEWRFDNILLPDSVVNEPESHGCVSYSLQMNSGLSDNTPLTNNAYIYFDGNAPIVTNQTLHTIRRQSIFNLGITNTPVDVVGLTVYPNPTDGICYFDLEEFTKQESFQLTDFTGRVVTSGTLISIKNKLDLSHISSGIYLLRVGNKPIRVAKVIKN